MQFYTKNTCLHKIHCTHNAVLHKNILLHNAVLHKTAHLHGCDSSFTNEFDGRRLMAVYKIKKGTVSHIDKNACKLITIVTFHAHAT